MNEREQTAAELLTSVAHFARLARTSRRRSVGAEYAAVAADLARALALVDPTRPDEARFTHEDSGPSVRARRALV